MTDALSLPAIGFGTYRLCGRSGTDAIRSALEIGYRLLDTAFSYENEGTVAAALAGTIEEGAIRREEVLVQSKIPGRHYGYESGLACVEESAARMAAIGPIDLYLLHWPNPEQNLYVETWRALIEARERGLIREIGVCNFLPEHLDRLEAETGVLPVVNQIESHPYFPNDVQIAENTSRGIRTQAWSPLGRKSDLLSSVTLETLAKETSTSTAEVTLAWHHQRGVVPLPKSQTPARQRCNFAAVDLQLTQEQMAAIDTLARFDGRLGSQDPATYQEL